MKRLLVNGKAINNDISLENKLKQLDDIITHKELVSKVTAQFVKYLFNNGQDQLALDLMKRSFKHDISKLENDEFYGMAEFADDKKALKDSKSKIGEDKQKAINLHWNRNEHHPEYWVDVLQMTDLDIMELVCDWYSRSLQFGTYMPDFLKDRQENRFHFPQEIYDKILEYYYMASGEKNKDKKVFLGGTCAESTWRKRLIEILDIDYFNPVVDNWNEEAQQKEIEERENCDYCLYTITPLMQGMYSIAEIIDDSNKRPQKTIVCLLKEDDNKQFTDAQWKSLYQVGEMAKRNGAQVFYNLEDVAKYLN